MNWRQSHTVTKMFIGMDLAATETKERVTRQLWIIDKTIFERDKPSCGWCYFETDLLRFNKCTVI